VVQVLKIEQTGLYLENEREVDIFFPPVRLDSYQYACLRMNFAAFTYFEVKLAYATPADNAYKERLMFRSIESLGEDYRLWKTTITPNMTEGQSFVVVLHSKSSSLGTMAIISGIKLLMQACNTMGKNVCFCYISQGSYVLLLFIALSVCLVVSRINQNVIE